MGVGKDRNVDEPGLQMVVFSTSQAALTICLRDPVNTKRHSLCMLSLTYLHSRCEGPALAVGFLVLLCRALALDFKAQWGKLRLFQELLGDSCGFLCALLPGAQALAKLVTTSTQPGMGVVSGLPPREAVTGAAATCA